MSSPPDQRSRPLSASRSFLANSTANSRPFLHMLSPLGASRKYAGYTRASQAVLEEDEDEGADTERDERGVGATSAPVARPSSSRSVGAPSASSLRPNVHGADGADSSDDEVPQSFMIETSAAPPAARAARGARVKGKARAGSAAAPILPAGAELPPVSVPPRPSELPQDAIGPDEDVEPADTAPRPTMRGLDAYERALWNWVNVYNLDAFLQEVYYYYEGKGIYCIALARALNLLTVGFVISFSTFLLGCVDYSRIRAEGHTRLSDVVVHRCVSRFSGFTLLFFLLFSAFYIWQIITFVLGLRRLVDMYHFYTHLLHIPDADIQTIAWPEVVRRIGAIREQNPLTALSSGQALAAAGAGSPATAKLDAHDVANRIMRQENYLISLFNKELLDLRVPLPAPLRRLLGEEEGNGTMLTRALEWNLRFCLMEYLFDPAGHVRKVFLKSKNRGVLIEGLRRRLIFMGVLNAIFAPFIVLYLVMYSFFRYFEEYHKNPSSIGSRRYTPFAQWKFREFNELPHLFARRLDESYPTANVYIAQFPNEKIALVMRFVSFVAGSFAAVLILASVLDPDLFLNFEVTSHRTVLFYITFFGTVVAGARALVPDEHRVFDAGALLQELATHTHYLPEPWRAAPHARAAHAAFGKLFVPKPALYVQELAGVLLTPFVLWLALPRCAPALVDFFREFTVHVDGLGYVCSFAVFDFTRHGNVKFGAPAQGQDARLVSNEGKMEKSFLNFKAAHPDWTPSDPSGSLYLSRMADYRAGLQPAGGARKRTPTDRPPAVAGTDAAREYDRALLESQTAARRRRPGAAQSTAALGVSTMLGQAPGAESALFAPGGPGPALARTTVLGDSAGSVSLAPPPAPAAAPVPARRRAIAPVDRTPDDGVGSALGESYADPAASADDVGSGEVDDSDPDGGVLGLLAQIYGTKGRAQGPARAI